MKRMPESDLGEFAYALFGDEWENVTRIDIGRKCSQIDPSLYSRTEGMLIQDFMREWRRAHPEIFGDGDALVGSDPRYGLGVPGVHPGSLRTPVRSGTVSLEAAIDRIVDEIMKPIEHKYDAETKKDLSLRSKAAFQAWVEEMKVKMDQFGRAHDAPDRMQ